MPNVQACYSCSCSSVSCAGELFELPGRPHVCCLLRNYGDTSFGPDLGGAKCAREDFGFLFKAFEAGQTPPHRLKKGSELELVPTIHQYLDWTITASSPAVRTATCQRATLCALRCAAGAAVRQRIVVSRLCSAAPDVGVLLECLQLNVR